MVAFFARGGSLLDKLHLKSLLQYLLDAGINQAFGVAAPTVAQFTKLFIGLLDLALYYPHFGL